MKKIVFAMSCVALALLVPISLVFAKGEQPAKVTIEARGMTTPIEVTDPETLKTFGYFQMSINMYVGEPYRVSFFSKNDRGELSPSPYYTLIYYLNPSGGLGYVYDPATSTGPYWYHATPESDAIMRRLLKNVGISSPASNVTAWSPWLVAALVTLGNGVATLWLLRRRQRTPAQL